MRDENSKRQIRLSYPASGETVLAEMLDDEAPEICKAIWEMLPIESKVIHGMYSGAEVFAMVENPKPLQGQNLVQIPLPGELLYYYEANLGAAGGKKPVGEIVVVYGRGVICESTKGFRPSAVCSRAFPAIGNMIGFRLHRNVAKHVGKVRVFCGLNASNNYSLPSVPCIP